MERTDSSGVFGAVLAAAAEFGEQPAVVAEGHRLSYQQLVQSAGALAVGLADLGVERGDRVALLLPNCPQFVISYLAITALGAVVVPLHCQLSGEEAAYILNNAQVRALISWAEFEPLVAALAQQVDSLTTLLISGHSVIEDVVNLEELISASADRLALSDAAQRDDAAVLIYTSGTTGRPKGALLSHRNLLANAHSCRELIGVTDEDRFLTVLPLFHSFGATVCMILPLISGACIVRQAAFVPLQVLQGIEEHGITFFAGVPSMFAVLARCQTAREYDLSSVRLCVSGGAALPVQVLSAFRDRYGVPLVEGYGPTEASPVVTVDPPDGVQKPGSAGLPIPGVHVRIVNEAGQDLPTGQIGEIIVAGENVMQGYWQNPAATAEAIREGWLYTGDLGKLDADGYLYIVDRKKDMIIVGGTNVYPQEVEMVISQIPGVGEIAVLGIPDVLRGERVRAVVVPVEGAELTGEQVIAHCRQHLAPFKVPHLVEFRDSLPKTHLGKVLKRKLRNEDHIAE